MNFKKVSISDKDIIQPYLTSCGRILCGYCFSILICWQHVYNCLWCVADGFLILKFIYRNGHVEYCQPIGDGDFTHLVPALEADAALSGQPFMFVGMTPEGVAACRAAYPDMGFTANRDGADYIYRASDMRDLPDHKYQNRRNLINKFNSLYQYSYVELTPALFDECLALETEWMQAKKLKGEGMPEAELDVELADELQVIKNAFAHWYELNILGGALYVGDRMVAYTFGSPLNDRTFCQHIEKADTNYPGAFQVIRQLFVQQLPLQYELIDNEEDMGIPNLRRAKLLYRPAFLAPQIVGRRLTPLMLQVRDLWLECFPEDTVGDADYFLLGRFDPSRMMSRFDDGRLVSMFHIIPFGKVAYLFAAATASSHRRRGNISALTYECIEWCRREGFEAVSIILANPHLPKLFASIGFSGFYPVVFNTPDSDYFRIEDPVIGRVMILPLSPDYKLPKPGETLVLSD